MTSGFLLMAKTSSAMQPMSRRLINLVGFPFFPARTLLILVRRTRNLLSSQQILATLLSKRQLSSIFVACYSIFLTLHLVFLYVSGSPVLGQRSDKSDVIPIIAGVLGAIVGIFLLGLVCFCFIQRKSRKYSELNCYYVFCVKENKLQLTPTPPPHPSL